MTEPQPNPETAPDVAPPAPPPASLRNRITRLARAVSEVWDTPDPDADPDNKYDFAQDELVARLATDDPEVAKEILDEAQSISSRMVETRVEGVERRAATLQSATAIAGSFSLAGGTLLVTQINGCPWKSIIGALLIWVTGNLGLCGWRATQASTRIHRWSVVRNDGVLLRRDQKLAEARVERAAQILRAAGWNARYARFKVDMLRRAGRHLSLAALGLPVLVAAVVVYALRH